MAARKRTSRKSSAASSRSRRDAERLALLVFFVDRSLGKRVVAQSLRDANARVEVHDDHFSQDATDIEWITSAGQHDWVVLSKDEQIRRNPLERDAIERASVKAFFLTQQGLSGPEMGEIFVRALAGMVRRALRQPGPFIFTVSRSGVFSRVL
jgi:predicted nuclease of predicted toxin-antitoxin system